MYDLTDAPAWPCEICGRPSVPRVHEGCRNRLDEYLTELPRLYRQLAVALQPIRRADGGRAGTRTAPLPCSLDALDLRARGGIEGILVSWEDDVRDTLGWSRRPDRGSVERTVDGAAAFLRGNIDWLCEEHPAIRELAAEIRNITLHARRLVTDDRPERRVTVACATDNCGGTLRVTLSTPGARCSHCGAQYGHSEVLQLPIVERTAA